MPQLRQLHGLQLTAFGVPPCPKRWERIALGAFGLRIRSSRVAHHWRRAAFGFALGLLVACGRDEPPASPAACEESMGPVLRVPTPVARPVSRISAELRVPVSGLERLLESRVPLELAKGHRNIGLPGRLSYAIRRGPFAIALDGADLVVTTPVAGKLSLCKPIAGFCPVYGRCAPRLQPMVRVPLRLTDAYEFESSNVAVPLVEGCRIGGFSADGQIRARARDEAATIQRQIEEARPKLRPFVDAILASLREPLSLGPFVCLSAKPGRMVQGQPTLVDRTLSMRFAVDGYLELERECRTVAAKENGLPPLTSGEVPRDSIVRLPLRLDWSELAREVKVQIAHQKTGLRVRTLKAIGANVGGRSLVVFTADLADHCGNVWLSAEAHVRAATSRLHLSDITVLDASLPQPAVAKLHRALRDVEVPLPVDLRILHALLEKHLNELVATHANGELSVDWSLQPLEGKVLIEEASALVVLVARGRAVITVLPPTVGP